MELDKEYQGYRYRAVDEAGREEMVHMYEHLDTWTLPDGSKAYRDRYICQAPPMTLSQYSEDPAGGGGALLSTQPLPADALMVTPVPPGGCTELMLPWIRGIMDGGVPGGKALVGVPSKGRRYGAPYCEDAMGNRSPATGDTCPPGAGRIIHHYEEIPLVDPVPEEIEWIFLITQDIALVSKLSSMSEDAGAFLEPTAGWLLPHELPGGTLASEEVPESRTMLYLGIGVAAAAVGFLVVRRA
jgi:hypothetical protein